MFIFHLGFHSEVSDVFKQDSGIKKGPSDSGARKESNQEGAEAGRPSRWLQGEPTSKGLEWVAIA